MNHLVKKQILFATTFFALVSAQAKITLHCESEANCRHYICDSSGCHETNDPQFLSTFDRDNSSEVAPPPIQNAIKAADNTCDNIQEKINYQVELIEVAKRKLNRLQHKNQMQCESQSQDSSFNQ